MRAPGRSGGPNGPDGDPSAAASVQTWTETVEVPIAELETAPWNPNVQDECTFRAQVDSIKRFGLVGPIVVRGEDRLIVAGHHRVRAMEELGATTVPCVLVWGLADEESKALSLALNRIHGEFEPGALETVLRELTEADIDLSGLGFGEGDLAVLLEGTAGEVVDPFPDPAGEIVEMVFEVPASGRAVIRKALAAAKSGGGVRTDGEALVVVSRLALRGE